MYKIALIVAGVFFLSKAHAQEMPQNLQKFDSKPYHFGFTLGYNSADFYMDLKPDFTFTDSLLSLNHINQPGFNLGIIASLSLTENIKLRFVPALSFQDRLLEYTFLQKDGETETLPQRVESTFLDFPLSIKFRTKRAGNLAAYFITGGKYSIDMASQKNVDNSGTDIIVKIKKNDYAIDVGGGLDFFLPYFKFGVELRLSVGMKDLMIQEDNIFADPIQHLRSKVWLLSFTFEG
jgi:hypothetical protein